MLWLSDLPDTFQLELQAFISSCRKTCAYVDHVSNILIDQAVAIMDQGFDSLIHQKFLIYAFQSPLPWYCRALDTGVALVLMVSCAFKPRVPLGGGHSSYL
ncbi:hypothetical protein LINPERPRIM_LOCUS31538 [Linum perenne]